MRFVKTTIIVILVFVFCKGAFAVDSASQEIEVSQGYLVWREGFEYMTRIDVNLSLENVKFKGEFKEKQVEGTQAKAFGYRGAMVYSTELVVPGKNNGVAERVHLQCDITKASCSQPTVKIDVNLGQKLGSYIYSGIPKELKADYELVRWKEQNKIILKPKHAGANNVLEKISPDFKNIIEVANEYMPAFQNMHYSLSWSLPKRFEQAQLTIEKKSSVKEVSKDVGELINREAKFLYTNILQSNKRKDGDIWAVRAEDLSAMIHSALEAKFRGTVLVVAHRIENERPAGLGERIRNGWKLEFIKDGSMDGRWHRSNIEFVCKSNDGKSHNIQLQPIGSRFIGELWLDNDLQMIRYGHLQCRKAEYNGKMPKIGNLNLEDLDIDAKINFELTYVQSVAAKERD